MVIKVAVIEKDPRFLDRLTAVFSKNYANKLEIYPFADPEVALTTLQFLRPNILIADESIRIPVKSLPDDCALAYFVSAVSTDQIDGHRAICKFQRAELIYMQIIGILSDNTNSATYTKQQNPETKIVTFTSPAGGVGVSTAAVAFSLKIASLGHRVLYLDLDAYSCPGLYFRGEGDYTFGDVLHTLVHKDGNLTELLVHATRKDPRGVSYFCESDPSAVYPVLTSEDVSRLLRELRIITAFDYIVLDIPFAKFLCQADLWEKSAGIVFLTDATEQAQLKLIRGYHTLLREASEKGTDLGSGLFLLNNKCRTFPMRIHELSALKDLGHIPFIPDNDPMIRLSSIASLSLFDSLI